MKIILSFALFSCLTCFGQDPEDLFRSGNIAYNKGAYDRAIVYYDSVTSLGVHSPELYFNRGNAYYKKNAIASSILNYEKALLLDADNEQLINNLAYAQNMTLDRFTSLPESELKKATADLVFLKSVRGWSMVLIAVFWLAVFSFFLFKRSNSSMLKRLFFTGFVISLLLSILTVVIILQQQNTLHNTNPAIVFVQSESFRAEPNMRSEVLLTIHEGAKVFILEDVEDWIKIKLQNGSIGWIPRSSVQPISFAKE
ncbi:MAG: ion channel protein [Flavobacteriaceae bacterium]|nr:ion channel protein [Flavobacteriaceae bacterium]|tara:strand:- start:1967 stop:2731 length:765 start_codon:yes stop_codon:yes gene_type:complete